MAVAAIMSMAQWLVPLAQLQVAGSFAVRLSAGSMIAVGFLPEALAVVEPNCHSGTVSGASHIFSPFKSSHFSLHSIISLLITVVA